MATSYDNPAVGSTSPAGYGTGTAAGYGTGTGTGLTGAAYAKVILTVKSAHNMSDKAWIGKSDPYAVIRVADAEIQTHHVKNAGEHAVWDESFAFNNVSPDDVIEFNVYDHNRLIKDAHMGEGSLSMRQVFEEGRMETRVPLTTRAGMKDAGEIWVSLRKEGGDATGAESAGLGAATGAGTAYTSERERDSTYTAGEREHETTYTTGERGAGMQGYTGTTEGYGTGGAAQTGREAVCGQEVFSKVEDRPILKERVTLVQEHRPVEKEFVVETRATGAEREAAEGRYAESMGVQERVVAEAKPANPCD